jgi:hypothetical protein
VIGTERRGLATEQAEVAREIEAANVALAVPPVITTTRAARLLAAWRNLMRRTTSSPGMSGQRLSGSAGPLSCGACFSTGFDDAFPCDLSRECRSQVVTPAIRTSMANMLSMRCS